VGFDGAVGVFLLQFGQDLAEIVTLEVAEVLLGHFEMLANDLFLIAFQQISGRVSADL
jgi:hypothetical protein